MAVIELPSGAALHAVGPEGTTPLLLLHGVGGGAWSWKPQCAALTVAHPVFVWEARGHGDARPVADAGLADYYADAREALLAVTARTGLAPILVGHSMGGLLAIALASDEPERVAGLFLIDPVYSDGTAEAYGHFAPSLGSIARWLCTPLLRSFEKDGRTSRIVARWMFEQAFEDRERMESAWADQRTQVPFEYPRMLRESFTRPEGFTLRDFALDVRVPAFLLEGSRFGGKPRFPALVAKLERTLGDRFTHERISGGHYLQLDRPEEVNARLAAFASAVPTVPAPA